jgi:hypothetical protein
MKASVDVLTSKLFVRNSIVQGRFVGQELICILTETRQTNKPIYLVIRVMRLTEIAF